LDDESELPDQGGAGVSILRNHFPAAREVLVSRPATLFPAGYSNSPPQATARKAISGDPDARRNQEFRQFWLLIRET
jgi:hypothetical protein